MDCVVVSKNKSPPPRDSYLSSSSFSETSQSKRANDDYSKNASSSESLS